MGENLGGLLEAEEEDPQLEDHRVVALSFLQQEPSREHWVALGRCLRHLRALQQHFLH